VLVTDIRLPGEIDGWQIAERCREHDPKLPVVYRYAFRTELRANAPTV
jgi:CheY-like chemotaxis protein